MADRGVADDARDAEALARCAGLHRAWAEHHAAMVEAVASAAALRAAFSRPADPAAEPSPPFAVPAPRREAGR